jgi:hypothetical protein
MLSSSLKLLRYVCCSPKSGDREINHMAAAVYGDFSESSLLAALFFTPTDREPGVPKHGRLVV